MAFQLSASLERDLLDLERNLLAHIGSHVVNPPANGVIRERNLLDFLFRPRSDHYFHHFFCAWLDKFLRDSMRLLTLRNSICHLVAALKSRLFLYHKSQMRQRRFQVVSYSLADKTSMSSFFFWGCFFSLEGRKNAFDTTTEQ